MTTQLSPATKNKKKRRRKRTPHPTGSAATRRFEVVSAGMAVLTAVVGVISSVIGAFLIEQPPSDTSLETRIADLSGTLQEAAQTIDATEREIQARQQLVEQLRQDQRRYEQLSRLDQAQVNAVAATLQGQLDRTERRARVATWLLLPTWGAILGVALPWGFRKIRRFVQGRRAPSLEEEADPEGSSSSGA